MITTKYKIVEFDKMRSQMYDEALIKYPHARAMDIEAMIKYLNPRNGDKILGIGEGNGFFCNPILKAIGKEGKYTVSDPSPFQLENLMRKYKYKNLEVQVSGAEDLVVEQNSFDKVWSFGAFHHCPNQTQAMINIYRSLKNGGKAVICDVFQGSDLARHFDSQVARYCSTGHEVKFLSVEFARSLCYLTGFKDKNVDIVNLNQNWIFNSEYEMGDFIYRLHAMTLIPQPREERIKKVIEGCKNILGTKKEEGKVILNWPMKCLKLIK